MRLTKFSTFQVMNCSICPHCNEFQVYSFGLMIYFILYSIGGTLLDQIVQCYIRVYEFTKRRENFIEETRGACNSLETSLYISVSMLINIR